MAATVLVVDDSECIRQLLCLTLKHAGYEVLEAEDAAAAVRLLRERHVDLMLADIDMPIAQAVHAVISGRATVDAAIEALLARPLRAEAE